MLTDGLICNHREKKRKKLRKQQNKPLTSIKEKGPLGKKNPFTRKRREEVSEDQEGCEQTSQQTALG